MNSVSNIATIRTRGTLALDTAERTLHRDGVRVPLTTAMYRLLEALVLMDGADLPTDVAYAKALGHPSSGPEDKCLAVLACWLRRRVPDVEIRAVRGVGYCVAPWGWV